MKIKTILANASSDSLLLQSMTDFLKSKIESAQDFIEVTTTALLDKAKGIVPVVSYSKQIAFNHDNVVLRTPGQDVVDAIINDLNTVTCTDDNSVTYDVDIDTILEQYSESVQTNRIVCEGLQALASSATDEAAAITTNFFTRVSTLIGSIPQNAALLASSISEIISAKGASIGDRVKSLLSFIGVYESVSDDPYPIGLPECQLTDITGTNVVTAWFNELPDDLTKWGEWLHDTIEKIKKIIGGLAMIVVGSSVYRSIKQFFSVLTLQSDSFKFNTGSADGNTISNVCRHFKLPVNYDGTIIWLDYPHPENRRQGCVNIYKAFTDAARWNNIPTLDDYTLVAAIKSAIESNNIDVTSAAYPLFQGYGQSAANIPIPNWMPEPQGLADVEYVVYMIYAYTMYVQYGSAPQPTDIYDAFNRLIGAILDFHHLNDGQHIADHLFSNSYVRIDLPCSSLYMWLVGTDIIVKRCVAPVSYFSSYTDYTAIDDKLFLSWVSEPVVASSQTVVSTNLLENFLSYSRSSTDYDIATDVGMIASVYAANVIDANYLKIVMSWYERECSLDDNGGAIIDEVLSFGDTFALLTGRTRSQWKQYFKIDDPTYNLTITNKTLAEALGATSSIMSVNSSSALFKTIAYLMIKASDDDSYVPYVHTDHVESGKYSVMTDSELASIFTTAIEIAIVIYATVKLLKTIKKLKQKALQMATIADANAWSQIENGTYTPEAVVTQYKLNRAANRINTLINGFYSGVSNLLNKTVSTIQNTVSAATGQLKLKMTGSSSSTENPTDLDTIKHLIAG